MVLRIGDGTVDGIDQFADIAGPCIGLQGLDEFRRNPFDPLAVPFTETGYEVQGKGFDVCPSLFQGR